MKESLADDVTSSMDKEQNEEDTIAKAGTHENLELLLCLRPLRDGSRRVVVEAPATATTSKLAPTAKLSTGDDDTAAVESLILMSNNSNNKTAEEPPQKQ